MQEVLDKATKRPLLVAQGNNVCFHKGNRVTITRYVPATETNEESETTVAEIWPAENYTDIYDGGLMAHAYNNFELVVKALEASQKELLRLAAKHKAFGPPDVKIIKANGKVLTTTGIVTMPHRFRE